MGKEYTRTLNNSNVEKKLSKKLSKKNSKKSYNSKSKKNANKNTNTSEEMLKILNSDTDVMYQSKNNNLQNNNLQNNLQNNNLIHYNGDLPQQYTNMNQEQQMNQQMNQQQMNNIGTNLPSNFDTTMVHQIVPLQNKEMFTNLHNLSRGPDISMSNNNFNSVSMPQDQGNFSDLTNLNMLGTTKI